MVLKVHPENQSTITQAFLVMDMVGPHLRPADQKLVRWDLETEVLISPPPDLGALKATVLKSLQFRGQEEL